jgi:hypothetical protein
MDGKVEDSSEESIRLIFGIVYFCFGRWMHGKPASRESHNNSSLALQEVTASKSGSAFVMVVISHSEPNILLV